MLSPALRRLVILAAFAVGQRSALWSQDAWKPDTQIGNFQFDIPAGWAVRNTPPGPSLVPTDLASGSAAFIGFVPSHSLSGDFRTWFDARWMEWQQQFRVVDATAPDAGTTAEGFDRLRLYARISSPTYGFCVFIYGAVHVGDRVESYFFISNADRESYLTDVESFESSLQFRKRALPATGATGGLDGLYIGYRTRGATPFEATHFEYLVFFPDGNAIRYLPEEGLEHFDFKAALKASRQYCGRYRAQATDVAITWGDNSTERAVRSATELKIGGDSYFPVSNANGLTLDGTYRREGQDLAARAFRFTSDGRFSEDSMLTLVAHTGADLAAGHGTYRIATNTLTLRYDDGRTVSLSFFIWPNDPGPRPAAIHVNTYRLVRDR